MLKNIIFHHFSKLDERKHAYMNALHISKKHKTIFFHIAKTGGSSIAHELQNNGYDDNILSNRNISRHIKLKYLKDVIKDWDSYYKFTFIRNKYDLLRSLYNMNKYFSKSIPNNITFPQFIENYIGKTSEYGSWLDQYNLTHINNQCVFDFIGKFESYESDRHFIFQKLNIKNCILHHNKGNYQAGEKLTYTENMQQIVKLYFKEEFNYFDWKYN